MKKLLQIVQQLPKIVTVANFAIVEMDGRDYEYMRS
jgi:hypothetical protein